jgi:hypothetical protein
MIQLTVTPDEVIVCPNMYIFSTTPSFYFVIPPSAAPTVIITMYQKHVVPLIIYRQIAWSIWNI